MAFRSFEGNNREWSGDVPNSFLLQEYVSSCFIKALRHAWHLDAYLGICENVSQLFWVKMKMVAELHVLFNLQLELLSMVNLLLDIQITLLTPKLWQICLLCFFSFCKVQQLSLF